MIALNREGFVVLPNLPITPAKPRREAWAKVDAAGVKVLRDEARLQVLDTTETGALRKAIRTTRDTRRKTGQVVAKVKEAMA